MAWIDIFNSAALARIETKVDTLMAQVQVAQEDLDALDASLDQVTADLAAHIDALVAALDAAAQAGEPLPAGSLDALQADVEALRALSAPAPEAPPEG